jgi:hypothetical protein
MSTLSHLGSDTPSMSIIDTVSTIVAQRVGFYRALAIGATAVVVTLITFVFATTQASTWLGWIAKFSSGASAVVGIVPFTAYLRWRGLATLCSNYRQLVIAKTQTPDVIGDAAFARISASFWRLYETSWEVQRD